MAVRALLGANKDKLSKKLIGTADLFQPEGRLKARNFQRTFVDVIPTLNDTAYGGTLEFSIPRVAQLLGNIYLVATHSSCSSTSATAGYPRRVDAFGYAWIELLTFSWGANKLQSMSGDLMKIVNTIYRSSDDQYGRPVYDGMQDNPSQRATDAATSLVTITPIPYWGSQSLAHHPIIDNRVMRDDLKVTLKTRDIQYLFETDGSDLTATLSSVRLRCELYHLEDDHMAIIREELEKKDEDFGVTGRMRLCTTFIENNQAVANSTEEATYSLAACRYLAREILFYFIATSDNSSSIAAARNRWNLQEINYFNVNVMNNDIAPNLTHLFARDILMCRFHAYDPTMNVYSWPFAYSPQVLTNAVGHLDLNFVGAAYLKMAPAATWATTGRLYLIFPIINIIVQSPSGDLRSLFIS